jgi:hypothetical protein
MDSVTSTGETVAVDLFLEQDTISAAVVGMWAIDGRQG